MMVSPCFTASTALFPWLHRRPYRQSLRGFWSYRYRWVNELSTFVARSFLLNIALFCLEMLFNKKKTRQKWNKNLWNLAVTKQTNKKTIGYLPQLKSVKILGGGSLDSLLSTKYGSHLALWAGVISTQPKVLHALLIWWNWFWLCL